MQYSNILVHYNEIALKGRNRPAFIKRLIRNIRLATSDLHVAEVRRIPGRIWLTAHGGHSFDARIFDRLKLLYGISHFSPVARCENDLAQMQALGLELVQDQEFETFRVTAKRQFKELPLKSMEVARDIGAHILRNRDCKVKMKGADLVLKVDMLPNGAYMSVNKIRGLDGLPTGISGKVCCMLSGGIDSPVAAFRMMRRGCENVFVHFHSHPFVTKASLEKAQDLAEVLVRHQNTGVLYSVPFGELQRIIVDKAPSKLRVILYRRFMVRIAEAIARKENAKALVSGESLAQVASQTLSNMVAVTDAATMPILRPLVGFDKSEIMDQARALGTYETSILPDQDCCTLFMPKDPETHANLEEVRAAEEDLDIEAMVQSALDQVDFGQINAPWYKPRKPRTNRAAAQAQP